VTEQQIHPAPQASGGLRRPGRETGVCWNQNAILALRLVRRLPQAELASLTGRTARAVRSWEAAERTPALDARGALNQLYTALTGEERTQFATLAAGDPRAADRPGWNRHRIGALRAVLGVTRAEFAARIGACPKSVALWETRGVNPRPVFQHALDDLAAGLPHPARTRFDALASGPATPQTTQGRAQS